MYHLPTLGAELPRTGSVNHRPGNQLGAQWALSKWDKSPVLGTTVWGHCLISPLDLSKEAEGSCCGTRGYGRKMTLGPTLGYRCPKLSAKGPRRGSISCHLSLPAIEPQGPSHPVEGQGQVKIALHMAAVQGLVKWNSGERKQTGNGSEP